MSLKPQPLAFVYDEYRGFLICCEKCGTAGVWPHVSWNSKAGVQFVPANKYGTRIQQADHTEVDLSSLPWRSVRFACEYSADYY